MIDDQDERDARDFKWQQAIERAVQRADRVILDAADGDNDVLMMLTVTLAERWVEKTKMMIQGQWMRNDMMQRSKKL